MRNDADRGPVLVAHRPGGGLLAQAVTDAEHTIRAWSGLAAAFDPDALAATTWWVVPDSLPVFAGSEAMEAETA